MTSRLNKLLFGGAARTQRVKLIFNPASGTDAGASDRLQVVIAELQAANLLPEVHLVDADHDLRLVIKDALRRGYRLFVAYGGDGTIDSVAGALAGTRGTLAIVPGGTRNNVAFNLGVPNDPRAAIALLRTGRRIKIDVGVAVSGQTERTFLEACSVGLLSALFPASDEIQHGNLVRLADWLSTLIVSPVAEMHLVLDGQPALHTQGHVLLAANMPFVGPRYPVAPNSLLDDGLLDLVVFGELSKLDLMGTAIQAATGGPEDPRIRRYQVRQVSIETRPAMPVVVDGFQLGEGLLRLSVRHQALAVFAGAPAARAGQAEKSASEPQPEGPAADQA